MHEAKEPRNERFLPGESLEIKNETYIEWIRETEGGEGRREKVLWRDASEIKQVQKG